MYSKVTGLLPFRQICFYFTIKAKIINKIFNKQLLASKLVQCNRAIYLPIYHP